MHTHLAMLRRENLIDTWYDRDILAGDEIDAEIAEQLESCELFIALLSPDFLNSDYCYEKEMQKAIDRHEAGELRIVPIIVEPCDWKTSPLKRFLALPKDGKPVSEWNNENTAYLNIVTELRRLIRSRPEEDTAKPQESVGGAEATTRNRYRVQRDFDEIDRDDFRQAAFREMAEYFRKSIAEIDQVEGLRGRFHEIGVHGYSCTVINKMLDSRGEAHITVRIPRNRIGIGDISYSFTENAAENTANGWFSVQANDYDLYLSWSSFGSMGDEKQMTAQNAAEALWEEFLGNAGISHD